MVDEVTTCECCGRRRSWADDPHNDEFWQSIPQPYARYYATGGDGSCFACYLGVGPDDSPHAHEMAQAFMTAVPGDRPAYQAKGALGHKPQGSESDGPRRK